MDAALPLVGTAEHFAQFVQLCRSRIDQLGITYATVDEVCGFPERYTAGVMSGGKRMSACSLFTLAYCLALKPLFAHDEVRLAELSQRKAWVRLSRPGPRWRSRHKGRWHKYADDFRKIRARKAGIAKMRAMTRRQRQALARKAALARWGRREAAAA